MAFVGACKAPANVPAQPRIEVLGDTPDSNHDQVNDLPSENEDAIDKAEKAVIGRKLEPDEISGIMFPVSAAIEAQVKDNAVYLVEIFSQYYPRKI